jgi:hypothetical protein
MRYLLKKDEERQQRLNKLANEYYDYRQKDTTKEIQYASINYYKFDLDNDLKISQMYTGEKMDIYEYIKYRINSISPNFVLDSFNLDDKTDEKNYRVRAMYYPASPTYLMVVNKLEYYRELKSKAQEYLRKNVCDDIRNIVEKDGFILVGKRSRNEYDAHWLGDFISFKKVMTSEEYDNELKKEL